MKLINIEKQDRVYYFKEYNFTLKNIVKLNVSKTGTHRLEDEDGIKYIVPSGWFLISFNAKNWTF